MGSAGPEPAAYYRPAEVAKLLRCSEWWVKEQARRRRIPFAWIGGSYLFTEEHIAEIVKCFEVRPNGSDMALMTAPLRRAPRADSGLDVEAPATLRSRPPRRSRTGPPSAAAA